MDPTPSVTRPAFSPRSAAFAVMAALSVVGLIGIAVSSLGAPSDTGLAPLYRRAGDTYVSFFYIWHSRTGSQPGNDPFLLSALDYYNKSVRADAEDRTSRLSQALVLYTLGKTREASQIVGQLLAKTTEHRARGQLGGLYLVLTLGRPSPSWINSAQQAVSGLAPGPLVLAQLYSKNGQPERAEQFLETGLAQAQPRLPGLAVMVGVCGLLLLVGLIGLVVFVLRRRREWGGPPPIATWGRREAAEAMVLLLFVQLALSAVLAPLLGRRWSEATVPLAITFAADLAAIGWVLVTRRGEGDLGWRLGHPGQRLFAGVALGGLIVLPAQGVAGLIETLLRRPMAEHPLVAIFANAGGSGTRAFLLLSACVLIPIFEETLFRGILYGALRKRLPAAAALWISAAVFAAFHFSLLGFLPYLLIGVALAWLYQRTGSLLASASAHAAYNIFLMMLLLVLFR